jgi:alkylation response protein AidB-like acyl-CoA dehydrogenase
VDTEETAMLTASLQDVFGEADDGADVSRLLAGLGWDDVVAEHPAEAMTLLFIEKGRARSSAALLDDVVLPVLAEGLPTPAECAGGPGGPTAVCYPSPGTGWWPSSTAETTTGILLRQPAPDERIVIPVAEASGISLAIGPASEFIVSPLPSLDAETGWYTVTGRTPAARNDGSQWVAAVTVAHRALAAEIVGVADRVLELAVAHTSTRRQFGAPIAAFQAVRHRLADAYVAVAAARALLDVAYASAPESAVVAAGAAKARAGRAHQAASASAVQVCGAMGATLEHPLHKYVNRGAVLDGLLGSGAELTAELGSMIRATVTSGGQIPLLVEV